MTPPISLCTCSGLTMGAPAVAGLRKLLGQVGAQLLQVVGKWTSGVNAPHGCVDAFLVVQLETL